jgi:hypothetical protein
VRLTGEISRRMADVTDQGFPPSASPAGISRRGGSRTRRLPDQDTLSEHILSCGWNLSLAE